jgi:hypothetical protein
MQVAGMLIAPIGMAGNLIEPASISESHILATLFGGLLIFSVGRALQGASGP